MGYLTELKGLTPILPTLGLTLGVAPAIESLSIRKDFEPLAGRLGPVKSLSVGKQSVFSSQAINKYFWS